MKRTRIDLSEEKRVLANMITNTSFLRGVRDIYKPGLFETSYAKVIAGWTWEYYERTGTAPGRDIQDLYLRKRAEVRDEEDIELIADYLTALNENYNEIEIHNVLYEVQKAETYFKLRSLEKLSEKINQAVTLKVPSEGEKLVAEYKRVEKPSGSGIDLFADAAAIRAAFDFHEERLFKFPGVLGDRMGYFCRGDFLAFLAPVKTGKTFYLFEMAKYAALFGFNSIFYSLEMTVPQMLRRSWKSLVGQPVKGGSYDLPCFEVDRSGKYYITKKTVVKEGIDLDAIEEKQKAYKQQARGSLKMETFPSGSGTLAAIKANLANLEYYDGFMPDVIVIDYADIVKADSRGDHRHKLNEIWLELRGWAQERNCLVVTVSQINKTAFTRDIKSGDVSEDSRKLAHVTQLYALNQTPAEKEIGCHRIEPLLTREGAFSGKQICVLENRDIGRVYLDSQLVENVSDYVNGKLKVEDE